jgi:hypothetical protein
LQKYLSMTTITIKSNDLTLINSILYLLKGNTNSQVQVAESNDATMLDFDNLDAETRQVVTSSIADYKNGRLDKFKTLKETFADVLQD